MKIISKFLFILIFLFTVLVFYLSFFGIETDRFNNQISNKIRSIDKGLDIELNKIKLILNPLKLKINIKTVGSKLKKKEKYIELENIKTQISLSSLIENKFSIENLEISTKSIEINNLITFIRYFKNTPELFILEKTVKKGYLIADIRLDFDSSGKIKDNYKINGFIKDAKLSILKKYNIQKLNLLFAYEKDNLLLNDVSFSLNDLNFSSENIFFKKNKDDFLVEGNLNNKNFDLDKKNLDLFIKPFFPEIDIVKMKFGSNNDFSFKINEKLQLDDFKLNSKVLINEISVTNKFRLKKFFPNSNDSLNFSNHNMSIRYVKDELYINGKGNILIQDKNDILTYKIKKKNDIIDFETLLQIDGNPFKIDNLNYEKNNTLIKLEGSKNKKNEILIKFFSIDEKKDKIQIKNLKFNKKFEIIKLGMIDLDYIDKDNQKNQIKLRPIKNTYVLNGSFFNANNLIDDLLFGNNDKSYLNINTKIKINIDKIYFDNENSLNDFNGKIFLKNKNVVKANLNGNFSTNKKLKFKIDTIDDNKITTLYLDKAESIVKRYKFIKGFDEGVLDFYNSKKSGQSISQLKIYNFKLKELPLLTKILTLASLQGIADILSGEGIRFDEFEMNFNNKGNVITINEIYAIGPAISILMDGYVEKNKLISLRGTLVPATTINKFIGSLPVLGKILVGSKTGEGVFGVSFKIKGPPKKPETSVNPIKTLTPRFITRTLEKIKKN